MRKAPACHLLQDSSRKPKARTNTINKKLAAVSSFCRFLAQEDLMDKDLTYGVKRPTTNQLQQLSPFSCHLVCKHFIKGHVTKN